MTSMETRLVELEELFNKVDMSLIEDETTMLYKPLNIILTELSEAYGIAMENNDNETVDVILDICKKMGALYETQV